MRVSVESVLLVAFGVNAALAQKRLVIRNGCDREDIWIAHMAATGTGPDKENVRIEPHASFAFQTPPGLSATRYWPKMGCDATGGNCTLGGSGGPGEACVRRPPEVEKDDYSNCAPPIDTKFEGTFGNADQPCTDAAAQGCDYVDMSLVDGWTLPFKLELKGTCTGQKGVQQNLVIDCAGLTFDQCPSSEKLTAAGDDDADLRAVHPKTKQVAGCYAPCQRLISDKWDNKNPVDAADPKAAPYCCPTPPESPEACRSGPIISTSFLAAVHGKCPGVYGYAYDDGMGLLRCTPQTVYELTFFCPDEKTNFQEARERLQKKAEQAEQDEIAEQAKHALEEKKKAMQAAQDEIAKQAKQAKQALEERKKAKLAAQAAEESEDAPEEGPSVPSPKSNNKKAEMDHTLERKHNASSSSSSGGNKKEKETEKAAETEAGCAQTFTEGMTAVNSCPMYTEALSEEECRTVPEKGTEQGDHIKLGEPFEIDSDSDPKGCFRHQTEVFWNKHQYGAPRIQRQVQCKTVCLEASVLRLQKKSESFSHPIDQGRFSWSVSLGFALLVGGAALALPCGRSAAMTYTAKPYTSMANRRLTKVGPQEHGQPGTYGPEGPMSPAGAHGAEGGATEGLLYTGRSATSEAPLLSAGDVTEGSP